MGFFAAARTCFAKYAVFDGRAARAEFWWFQLWILLIAALLAGALVALEERFGAAYAGLYSAATIVAPVLFTLVFFLPALAVSIRRLHDGDRSGWNYLWSFVPVLGPILLLVWWCRRGTPGANRYGLDPLHVR